MKNILQTILFVFILIQTVFSQVVSTDKDFPVDNESLKITFNAAIGTAGLKGYSGDVYAHIGLITENSASNTDWKYVIHEWGKNSDKIKCSKVDTDVYELNLTPSVRSYFGVAEGESVQKIALVFRNANGSLVGKAEGDKDIYIQLYKEELSIRLDKPTKRVMFVDASENITIEGQTAFAERTEIFVDDVSIYTSDQNQFSYSHSAKSSGTHTVKVVAYNNTKGTQTQESFVYTVRGISEMKDLPTGLVDGVNVIDANTATFVLHAPHKASVYLIGDFNDWTPSASNKMFRSKAAIEDNDLRFWITIDGLDTSKEYAFQYLVDETLHIADPYTEKVVDPATDKWIPAETYPDLVAYPTGKTEGVLSLFSTKNESYVWEVENFEAPAKNDLVIYELLLRDFTEGPEKKEGNFKNAMAKLDYLDDLGVNVIELMPINEFEGNNSWGYNPSFMFAVDKAYGSKADFKLFVDECHKRGIAVVVDIVMNHQFGGSPFVALYLDKHTDGEAYSLPESPWFNEKSPNQAYKWGADFNHESKYTQQLLDRLAKHWLTEFKVDGFRYDFTKGFTNKPGDGWARDDSRIAILKRMYDEVMKVNPKAYVILEHLVDNSEEKELAEHGMMLWGNMNEKYNEATKGNVKGSSSDLSDTYYKRRNWTVPHLISYMESHDEERLMYRNIEEGEISGAQNVRELETALYRVGMAANFFFMVPGPKMIWQFGELGYDYSIDNNGRVGAKPIKWDYLENTYRKHLYKTFGALAKLKTEHDVFDNGTFEYDLSGAIKTLSLDGDELDVVLVGNFDVYNKVNVPVTFTESGKWYEFFTGEEIELKSTDAKFNLQPGQYHLFTSKKLEKPEMPDINIEAIDLVTTDISTGLVKVWNGDLEIYPNPTAQHLSIEKAKKLNFIGVYSNSGQLLIQVDVSMNKETYSLDLSDLQQGTLFIVLENDKGQRAIRKVIKL